MTSDSLSSTARDVHRDVPAASPSSSRHVSLALSGGNALGAYEAGAYEALHEAGCVVNRVSGASIGSVNAAILAGNPPQRRIEKLREFWQQAATWSPFAAGQAGGRLRDVFNKLQAMQTLMTGRPGMFAPRPSGFLSLLPGTPPDVGLFDGRPLLATLSRVVDFELLNQAALPLVIGCVDLESGEPVYFDSRRQRIEAKHLLASTAFLPGFPPVEIDGRLLGDPGMLCNLPLDPLLGEPPSGEHLCFAIDLFDVRGGRPFSMDTALERVQDIAFASQSLRTIDAFRREYRLRHLLAQQMGLTRKALAADRPDQAPLPQETPEGETTVVLLAYRPPAHEVSAKSLEFSSASIEERWNAGRDDMRAALAALEAGRATTRDPGFSFYDSRRAVPRPASAGNIPAPHPA
ncbi:patatin-like phospholipase family protein [Azohydromonas caseinilytica]|uniref:Patatin-like phospholipase family protein n=1 Tax=Azohydromonas caseinilytica TaxID=2728836 RepID=A0A848FJA9_9BURK|nr:patatin-like phospholipase family protein [Azohydromonas caseinilytica]NML18300.1 patatin-like phospholipase family protein [Azohydromonas caseinilytica]